MATCHLVFVFKKSSCKNRVMQTSMQDSATQNSTAVEKYPFSGEALCIHWRKIAYSHWPYWKKSAEWLTISISVAAKKNTSRQNTFARSIADAFSISVEESKLVYTTKHRYGDRQHCLRRPHGSRI